MARPVGRAGLLRVHGARPRHRRAVDRRPEAPAGPHRALAREGAVRERHRQLRDALDEPRHRRPRVEALVPRIRPRHRARRGGGRHPRGPHQRRRSDRVLEAGHGLDARGRVLHARQRCGDDRRDHVVHQHVEPLGHARGGPARPQGDREGPQGEAVGQDHARARLEGRHRLLRQVGAHEGPRRARLLHGRLRLHDVHRQLGPPHRGGLGSGQRARPRRDRGALGQPQLRGPHQPRREDELPSRRRRS